MFAHSALAAPPFTLIPAASIVLARDLNHAETLLRDSGCRAVGAELRRLAQQVVQGTLLVVRPRDAEPLDDVDIASQGPLLTTLMAAG